MIPHDRIRLIGRLLCRGLAAPGWKKTGWRALLLLYAAVLFTLSSLPMSPGRPILGIPSGDKLVHAGEFAVFFLLASRALAGPGRGRVLLAFVLTSVYAGTDEFHQLFVATRTASVLDWLADLAGAGAAALLTLGAFRSSLWRLRRLRILKGDNPDREG